MTVDASVAAVLAAETFVVVAESGFVIQAAVVASVAGTGSLVFATMTAAAAVVVVAAAAAAAVAVVAVAAAVIVVVAAAVTVVAAEAMMLGTDAIGWFDLVN
jgi:hypothetical protein